MDTKTSTQLPEHFTFSQASLQDYNDCPRRFQLRYIEHLSWPAVESEPVLENEKHQQEGNQFHRLVQQYLIGLPEEKLTKLANSPNLLRWWENFLNSDYISKIKKQAKLYPEHTLVTPIGMHRLVAKYDLIAIQPENKCLIVDWKTYRKRPGDDWMALRWQTRVYQALLGRAGDHLTKGGSVDLDQIEMVYWYTNYPSEPAVFSYNQSKYERSWELIETTIREITETQSFGLTADEKKCSFCPYRSYCDRGGRAGDWQQSESEIDTEAENYDLNFEQIGEIAF